MTRYAAQTAFVEVVRALNLEATYFCGMLTVRSRAGRFLGRKSAEDWMHPTPLDAIRALLDAEDAATRERR